MKIAAMYPLDTLMTFLGWCSILNTGILLFSTIVIIIFKQSVSRIHGAMFDLEPETVALAYFQYLGNYKIAIIIFNLVPYLSLKLMS